MSKMLRNYDHKTCSSGACSSNKHNGDIPGSTKHAEANGCCLSTCRDFNYCNCSKCNRCCVPPFLMVCHHGALCTCTDQQRAYLCDCDEDLECPYPFTQPLYAGKLPCTKCHELEDARLEAVKKKPHSHTHHNTLRGDCTSRMGCHTRSDRTTPSNLKKKLKDAVKIFDREEKCPAKQEPEEGTYVTECTLLELLQCVYGEREQPYRSHRRGGRAAHGHENE